MSTTQWNDEQLRAITERGSDLLVAAAAGSGKTAVLVERLLRRVTEEGHDIDSFLVVTFTRAAAAEMLEKFSSRLTALTAANPENRRLRRQLRALPRAHINTVHGFCASFLRERFQAAGLSPDFRVLDGDEAKTMRQNALAEVLEARYENASPDFLALSDALSAVRDDSRLTDILLSLHDRMSAHPHPEEWVNDMKALAQKAAQTDPADNVYGAELMSEARQIIRYHIDRYRMARRIITDNPAIEKYGERFESEYEELLELENTLEVGSWDEALGKLAHIYFLPLPRVPNSPETEEDKNILNSIRNAWKKAYTLLETRLLVQNAAEIRADAQAVLPLARELTDCVTDLDAAYTEAKRRKSCVDFSDLEHLTLHLLQNPDGSPSAAAEELSASFTEIMVDEYQDTNAVQDAIFATLSRNNLFIVGDMKQSIYRFRLADPRIFLARYNSYPDAEAAVENQPRKVVLSRNYRSRAEVLTACNRLFAAILSPSAGELAYTTREYLYPGREDFPENGADHETELVLVETESDDEGTSSGLQEARYVAARIRDMVHSGYPITDHGESRPASWGDFAILLRGFSGRAEIFTQALEEYGIPSRSEKESALFDTPEAALVLSALECVDNPRQDIPLTALMRAPMYAFTADELAALRVSHDGPFWQAVFSAAESEPADADGEIFVNASRKARKLLSDLDVLRRDAETLPLSRTMWHICSRMGIFESVSAMKFADNRRANLYALFEYAARFERSGYRGLYRFLSQLRRLRQSGQTPGADTPGGNADSVRIMSIHKSKGLQFPIVFVSGCAAPFNNRSLIEPILIHPKLGVGLKRRLLDERVEYPTAAYNAIRTALQREQRSEEMRVLYVAMTRAEEKLILTAGVKNPESKLETYSTQPDELPCPPRAMLDSRSFLEWMLRALLSEGEGFRTAAASNWRILTVPAPVPETVTDPPATSDLPEPETEINAEIARKLELVTHSIYAHAGTEAIPSKLTATQITGTPSDKLLDTDAAPMPIPSEESSETSPEPKWTRPRFLMEQGLTPSERGIALHMAMQFADYAHCQTLFDCKAELNRLKTAGFLSAEQAQAVNPEKLLRFFHSPLGKRLLTSTELHREFRFSLPVNPSLYAGGIDALSVPHGEDSILLQGVIDCWFAEDDGLVVVDFKTDRIPMSGSGVLLERYRPQLTAYAHALERITGRHVKECCLYLFANGEALGLRR